MLNLFFKKMLDLNKLVRMYVMLMPPRYKAQRLHAFICNGP